MSKPRTQREFGAVSVASAVRTQWLPRSARLAWHFGLTREGRWQWQGCPTGNGDSWSEELLSVCGGCSEEVSSRSMGTVLSECRNGLGDMNANVFL